MPKSFTEDGAVGAGGSNTGGYNPAPSAGGAIGGFQIDDSGMGMFAPHGGSAAPASQYGTWGADTGAPMGGGVSNITGVNGNTAKGTLNSLGKSIGSDMTYDDWMQYGGGKFGQPAPGGGGGSSVSLMFDDGGEVPGMDFDPVAGMRGDLMNRLAAARSSVKNALAFGRKQNGLDQLSYNPSQSDSGIPRSQPGPGTLPAPANPFGQRRIPPPKTSQLEGQNDGEELGFNPSQSDTGTPRPAPSPGTLPAPANPFGRRQIPPARTSQADTEEGAILDDEETA